MENPSLQDIIRQNISLNPRPNSHGFFSVLCKVCNDHGKKGKRAGFKFEGDAVGYNCFNCGHAAGYDPAKHVSPMGEPFMPQPMVTVLDAFNIPKTDWQQVMFTALVNHDGTSIAVKSTWIDIEPKEVQFPSFFYPLTDDPNDEWAQCAIDYLRNERGIDYKHHSFHLVKKIDHPDNERWYGRLIIPTYKFGKLIFWQGRDLTGTMVKKYMSPNVPRDNILDGFEAIEQHSDLPLYITEGWFDAFHLEGVAVFGNKLTPAQIKWINRSSRPKVVIPDKFGDGQLLALQALELGWSVSLPDIGSCKDVNDAVLKYGQLYTQMTIKDHTYSGEAAEVNVMAYCENGPPRSKKTHKASR